MADVLCLNEMNCPSNTDVSQEELDWYINYLFRSTRGTQTQNEKKYWYFRGVKLNVKD